MNRSLRLLRPVGPRQSLLNPSSVLSRSSFLPPKPQVSTSKLPVVFTPRLVGVRLYVNPSAPLGKDDKTRSTAGDVAAAASALGGKAVEGMKEAVKAPVEKAKEAKGQVQEVMSERGAMGNAMAEARDVVSDLASIISGGRKPPVTAFSGNAGAVFPQEKEGIAAAMETSSHSHSGNVKEDFMSITTGLMQSVPNHILLFGLAGTLPYLGTSVGTIFLAREANMVGNGYNSLLDMNYDTALEALHTLEAVQITYGATILSFLGALHWGMEFVGFGGEQGYKRLIVGTIPLLIAWPTTFMSHGLALAFQWVGFTTTWFMDQRATQNGWTPEWFATYRFYLSIIVGFSIIGTLAGTSYYEEGAGSGLGPEGKGVQNARGRPDSLSATKMPRFNSYEDKAKNRRQNDTLKGPSGPVKGTTTGDVWIDASDENLEAYGKIRSKSKEAEADEEEEEEDEGAADEGEKDDDKDEKEDKEKNDKADEKDKEDQKDKSQDQPSEDQEGGSAGKSQTKKDKPEEKGKAGEENTATR